MARRKNLLEAFQRSQASADAPVAPSGPAEPALPLFERPPGGARGPGLAFGWPLAALALVVAFALGYVAGRAAERPAEAEERPLAAPPANQPRGFQERPTPAPAALAVPPEAPRSLEESALFDPANLYTVIVVSYPKNQASTDFAWATVEHLQEAGLPVFPPVESGNLLVVLAGAAPTSAELAATEASVRALVRDGKKSYDDAYRVRIDKLIPRTKSGS